MSREKLLTPQELDALLADDDETGAEMGFEQLLTPDDFVLLVDWCEGVFQKAFAGAASTGVGTYVLDHAAASLIGPEQIVSTVSEGDYLIPTVFYRGLIGSGCFHMRGRDALGLAAALLEGPLPEEGEGIGQVHRVALDGLGSRWFAAIRKGFAETFQHRIRLRKARGVLSPAAKKQDPLAALGSEEHLIQIGFFMRCRPEDGSAASQPGDAGGPEGESHWWITLELAKRLIDFQREAVSGVAATSLDATTDEPAAKEEAAVAKEVGSSVVAKEVGSSVVAKEVGTPAVSDQVGDGDVPTEVSVSVAESPAASMKVVEGSERGEPVRLTGVVGEARLTAASFLNLDAGHLLRLDRLAGETVDLMAGGQVVAKGEVVVDGDHFAVKVLTICSRDERSVVVEASNRA